MSLQTIALDNKDSWLSTHAVEALALVSIAFCSSVCLSITARNPSSVSPHGPALRFPESDFSKNLAAEKAQESDSVEAYEQQTQENMITKETNEQDVKYKTQEFKGLDKEITELTGDKETSGTELAAVMEYYGKIKDRCVAKPETYEEPTERRNAEVEGLKQALQILNDETAFVQRKRRVVRGAMQ